MKKLLFIYLTLFAFNLSAQNGPHEIIVKVKGIKSYQGNVMVALFDSQENFLGKRLGGGKKLANSDSIIFTFKGIEAGVYAVSIFHDENDNGKLDANFMGIPNEPYAFSNNAKGMFGPPSFEDCKFEIVEKVKKITITL